MENDETIKSTGDNSAEQARQLLADALSEVFSWQAGKRANARTIGLKTAAALWVVRPAFFGSASLNTLAQRMGCSPSLLSKYAAQFRGKYNL